MTSAGIWLVISHIDISIKSSGIIRNINEGIDISNQINGTVSETFVKDGEYVSKGDILYRMVNNDIEDTLKKLTKKISELLI